jgi:NAD(P)-dependent dehydrogenase (short-subunit alcohol dehydrogenase family)
MTDRFLGKSCIVTGAGSGIGRAVAERLASEGARVIAVDMVPERVDEVVDGIRGRGGLAEGLVLDVADHEAPARIAEVAAAVGDLGVLCNVAGIGLWKPMTDTTRAEWQRVLDVNVSATYFISQAAIPLLRRSGGGAIVNVASVHSFASWADCGVYAASKGAVLALTRSMAIEFAGDHIRVNAVAPGTTDTRMVRDGLDPIDPTPELEAEALTIPVKRLGEPAEIAAAIAFLASSESDFTTGACLLVDGGMTARL